ncbi:hypothetical protein GBAR_LOCUS29586 [Geodia barretti]|uniref:Uncharacterized protein n=1 Tax=Geodia barretti TaxID=519541 RepID=A0AA35TW24_GEOBA|nr:hypothetical protein GBAR_LOCUS29586 [Geodia barretti]
MGGRRTQSSYQGQELTLWRAKKEQAVAQKKPRLPITPAVLEKLRVAWNRVNHTSVSGAVQ